MTIHKFVITMAIDEGEGEPVGWALKQIEAALHTIRVAEGSPVHNVEVKHACTLDEDLMRRWESASGNEVRDEFTPPVVLDEDGHYITEYSDGMAREYLGDD